MTTVSPQALYDALRDRREIALLDVREEAPFSGRHILRAVPAPMSRLELALPRLVPRPTTRVVLCDAGEGLAERAAARLAGFGYADVAVLVGGIEAWETAGLALYAGVHVPSKAFGEHVEQACKTPRIAPAELARRLDRGENIVVLDARPVDEYRRMSIPGGIDVPGAELVYRVHDIAPDPATRVVVNCAGRTRSIIGAQSLIEAGIANPVAALENGTMGWHLAGLGLEHGAGRSAPAISAEGLAKAREAAERVAARFGVTPIDADGLARLATERDRTLYLLDVRSPEEYRAGHLAGARSAPGGQLVQATDSFVGTWNARLVLVDDSGVRATMTASWLRRMGWPEVFVLAGPHAPLVEGDEAVPVLGLEAARPEAVSPAALAERLAAGATRVVDLDTSLGYRAGHIPGAWFAIRANLGASLPRIAGEDAVVLTSPDGVLARLAAAEAGAVLGRPVAVLAGGTGAWRAAGLALEAGHSRMADAPDDVWYKPYDHDDDVEAGMRAYLAWEVGLVERVAGDGTCPFPIG